MLINQDTSIEAQEVQYRCWARMTVSERYLRMVDFSASLLEASRHLIDQKWPFLSASERYHKYLEAQYGEPLASRVVEYLKKIR